MGVNFFKVTFAPNIILIIYKCRSFEFNIWLAS